MRRSAMSMCLAGCVLMPMAATAADDADTRSEQALAQTAEQHFRGFVPDRPILPPLIRATRAHHPGSARGVPGSGLFVGVDDAAVSTWFIDPSDGTPSPGFTGTEVWGAAHVAVDADNYLIFITEGSELAVSTNGQPASACCTLSLDGVNPTATTGAAFDPNVGRLLFSRNLSPESIFSLDYSETLCSANPICTLTELVPTNGDERDLGGLAFDPGTQTLYATDDTSRQLVEVQGDGSLTPVADYPFGETDIDGLAYDDGKLFLVTDEPGSIHVYDIATATYGTALPAPWVDSEVFAGATFVPPLSEELIFRNGFESIGP